MQKYRLEARTIMSGASSETSVYTAGQTHESKTHINYSSQYLIIEKMQEGM
jgi:hypothetical protein